MERMMGGSLFHLLQDESIELPWELRYRIAYEIAQGLWSLHSQEILHRDLKSLNVLLDEEKHAKITDFGFSKLRGQVTSMAPSSKHSLGTPAYKSPELVAQDLADSSSDEEEAAAVVKKPAPYTPYSDVYAYGVILWELATRQTPFAGQEPIKVYKKIAKGKHEKIPADCPAEFAALIKKCWAMKPGQRPRTDEIVAQTKAWYEATQAAAVVEVEDKKDDFAAPWHIDQASKKAAAKILADKQYPHRHVLLPAAQKDVETVVASYQRAPVPGYSIKAIKVMYNPLLNQSFDRALGLLDARHQNPAFTPGWRSEQGKTGAWRKQCYELLETMAAPHKDPNHPHLNLVPMWHATDASILPSIFEAGFATLGLIDAGYFGRGIYSAGEARYSYNVYGKIFEDQGKEPALLMNWVASYSAYPVIDGDKSNSEMRSLEGKGNYANYDAHFIPVRPNNPNNPNEKVFFPCQPGQAHKYSELVVFDKAHCLPRYVVELQSDDPDRPIPQAIEQAKQKHQAEQAQKAHAEQSTKDAEKLKAEKQVAEQAQKEADRIALETAKAKQIEAEKEAAVKKAVEQSEKAAALAKKQTDAQAAIHAAEMEQLKAKLAAMEAESAKKIVAEKLAAEKAKVEADQKYAEKVQKEKEQEKAEKAEKEAQRRKGAEALESKEAETEGRIKVYSHFWKPAQQTPPQVAAFLRLVAEGEQDKAEAMLKANGGLALQSGTVTDLSNRTFKHITGFQYAVWAMDWHMWTMLLKYVPREEAALQLQALEENGTEHGKHFDLNHLVGALDTYVKNYDAWNGQQCRTHWCQQVGGAQLLLPAHVVNEYCRPDRSFDPVPDFTKGNLPRVRTVYVNKPDDEWFSVVYNGGKIGNTFACVRGGAAWSVGGLMNWLRAGAGAEVDHAATQKLMKSREQQLQGLKSDLLLQNNPVVAAKR